MKNQYFGDENDYRKYGLLRILSGLGQFRIGVCWMLAANDGRTDGQLTCYLNAPKKWRLYDPQLFDHLHKSVIVDHIRNVQSVQSKEILPVAKFYNELLHDQMSSRQTYFKLMRQRFVDMDMIFFDPDNGIEIKSKPMGRKGSSKYLYWSELCKTFAAGQSILVYQHFTRESRTAFIKRMVFEYQSHTGAVEIHWFQTSRVIYFLATQPKHAEWVRRSVKQVMEQWGANNQILAR